MSTVRSPHARPPNRVSEREETRIARLREMGWGLMAIAKELGRSKPAVKLALKRMEAKS